MLPVPPPSYSQNDQAQMRQQIAVAVAAAANGTRGLPGPPGPSPAAYTDPFTGDGATTAFVLSHTPSAARALTVSIAGVTQLSGTAYNLATATVTFTEAPPTGLAIIASYTV